LNIVSSASYPFCLTPGLWKAQPEEQRGRTTANRSHTASSKLSNAHFMDVMEQSIRLADACAQVAAHGFAL
jgi:hypothetical protein